MSGRVNLLDTNIWLALAVSSHAFHAPAESWMKTQAHPKSTLFCRATQQSLLRLLTTEKVMDPFGLPAMTNSNAWAEFDRLMLDPRIFLAPEPSDLDKFWKGFTTRHTASPKMWMDAYLAAFAVAGNYKLITADKAFAQYPGLDLHVLTL